MIIKTDQVVKLDDGNSNFVHVDESVDLSCLKLILIMLFSSKRIACNWGGFSLVSATLN